MNNDLLDNLDKIHTTDLGIMRIKTNLALDDVDVVQWCIQKIKLSDDITRRGKNWYIHAEDFVLTINAHSYTIITAHKTR